MLQQPVADELIHFLNQSSSAQNGDHELSYVFK